MEAIYLQSMTDFVLEKMRFWGINDNLLADGLLVKNYANFLKQPLQLGFFVPCDENGNVLSEPKAEDYFNIKIPTDQLKKEDAEGLNRHYADLMLFEDAEKRVLFKVEYKTGICNNKPAIWINGRGAQIIDDFKFLTIEDLAHWNFELTDSAIKQIGL